MSEITPETVAAALAVYGCRGYDERLAHWVACDAIGSTVRVSVSRVDDDGEDVDTRCFRAVVVEGETDPIVLPAGAAADYINGDDGYHWLTCGTCETPLMEVQAGTHLVEMVQAISSHTCAEPGGE
ncbi:hypothetical protein ACWEJ6_21230 [Nonomuraea sp. NPDC004702]